MPLPPPPRSLGKRKAGHIGFQKSEIAFIEDEMAALAAEYGLAIDQDVAANVGKRQDNKKKARLRRQETAKSSGKQTPTEAKTNAITLAVPPRRRVVIRSDFSGDHDLINKILRNVLPEGVALAKCEVPGCGCGRGNRETLFAGEDGDRVGHESDVIRLGVCKKCRHGVLQHALVEDASSTASGGRPSGGQRLLGTLYQLIRSTRLAGTVFRSRVWVASLLEMLGSLLAHVRKQIAGGGAHNGQKTVKEMQQEHAVLVDLEAMLKKAERASQKAVSRDELPIEIANALDPMYFRVYYATIVVYGRACAAVPSPVEYFSDLESFTPEIYSITEAFVNQELAESPVFKSLSMAVETSASTRKKAAQGGSGIALLELFHLRFREGVRLFYEAAVGMHGEMDALLSNAKGALTGGANLLSSSSSSSVPSAAGKKKALNRREAAVKEAAVPSLGVVDTPAYELLKDWRSNCRDWLCRLYAYAVPSGEAVAVVAKYAPLVEVGAGTGYWCSVLSESGVDVMAYDIAPPAQGTAEGTEEGSKTKDPFAHLHKKKGKEGEAKYNEWHGETPTFTSVARGGHEMLKAAEGRSLLLCCPPGDDMAHQCLQSFKGTHVIYVGEWQGAHADRAFERKLMKKYALVEELALPNWGSSAMSLTVWKRQRGGGVVSPVERLSCFHCHSSLVDAEEGELKRCALCRTCVYCSPECVEEGRGEHAAEHAMRLVFLEDESKLEFDNDLHYKPLEAVVDEGDGGDSSEGEEEEEEAKVVVSKSNWKALTTKSGGAEGATEEGSTPKPTSGFAFNFNA